MAIFITAGHTLKGSNKDNGASGNGYVEAALTVELRDKIIAILKAKGAVVQSDIDSETLSQVIARLNPTEKDLSLDLHWNASDNAQAGGVETFIPERHTHEEKSAAKELSANIAAILGIKTRGGRMGQGIKTESESARKTLGILRSELGINLLVEVCFISNASEMQKYQLNKDRIALMIADFLIKWDAAVK